VGYCIWYSEEGTGQSAAAQAGRPLLAVPNVAHPSTASVPITVFPYNGPFLCGFNVPFKGLNNLYKTRYSRPKSYQAQAQALLLTSQNRIEIKSKNEKNDICQKAE